MAGTCDVVMAPSTWHRLERVLAHARLLRADVLHVELKYPGQLGQEIDVATGSNELKHVATLHRSNLLSSEPVLRAIGGLVADERVAVGGVVERVAHLVECVATPGHRPVEERRARDVRFTRCGGHRCFSCMSVGRVRRSGPRVVVPTGLAFCNRAAPARRSRWARARRGSRRRIRGPAVRYRSSTRQPATRRSSRPCR